MERKSTVLRGNSSEGDTFFVVLFYWFLCFLLIHGSMIPALPSSTASTSKIKIFIVLQQQVQEVSEFLLHTNELTGGGKVGGIKKNLLSA